MRFKYVLIFLLTVLLFLPSVISSQITSNKDVYRRVDSFEIIDQTTISYIVTTEEELAEPKIKRIYLLDFPFSLHQKDVEVRCNNEPLYYFSNINKLVESENKGYLIKQIYNATVLSDGNLSPLVPTGKSVIAIHYKHPNSGIDYRCKVAIKIKDVNCCQIQSLSENRFVFQSNIIRDLPENLDSYHLSVTIPNDYSIVDFDPKTDILDNNPTFIEWGYGEHFSFETKRPPEPLVFRVVYEEPIEDLEKPIESQSTGDKILGFLRLLSEIKEMMAGLAFFILVVYLLSKLKGKEDKLGYLKEICKKSLEKL